MPVELKESGSAVVSPETVEAEEAGDDVEEARVHDPKNLLLDDDCHCCARVAKNWLICGRKRGRWPATCFVGPDWPCMCCTYSLILGALVLGHAHGQVVQEELHALLGLRSREGRLRHAGAALLGRREARAEQEESQHRLRSGLLRPWNAAA